MKIGTVRIEEARVKDSMQGFHQFENEETGEEYGSFEVFWDDSDTGPWGDEPRNYDAEGDPVSPGWYWWACFPGCMPEGEPVGPFSSSIAAYVDAIGV